MEVQQFSVNNGTLRRNDFFGHSLSLIEHGCAAPNFFLLKQTQSKQYLMKIEGQQSK
jgi:hypothetical protein